MNMKPVSSFVTIVLGAVLIVSPVIVGSNGLVSYDQAFAQKGGNSVGNANSASAASTGNAKTTSNANGQVASKLGALNAAHASARAFAHASPDSRIGKIKTYYLANQIAIATQATAAATDAAALKVAFEATAPTAVISAYEALQADPTNVTLQDAFNAAVTNAGLLGAQVTTLQTAYTDWQNAVAADTLAADAAATAQIDLNAAANKTPVDAATKTALDALLVDKIY